MAASAQLLEVDMVKPIWEVGGFMNGEKQQLCVNWDYDRTVTDLGQ